MRREWDIHIPGVLVNQDSLQRGRGGNTPMHSSCSPKRNLTTSSPSLFCRGSRHNAFSVTNSRCFPIDTLPSQSLGMCVYYCACHSRLGWWGLKLSAGHGRSRKLEESALKWSGIAVNANTTLLYYRLLPVPPPDGSVAHD